MRYSYTILAILVSLAICSCGGGESAPSSNTTTTKPTNTAPKLTIQYVDQSTIPVGHNGGLSSAKYLVTAEDPDCNLAGVRYEVLDSIDQGRTDDNYYSAPCEITVHGGAAIPTNIPGDFYLTFYAYDKSGAIATSSPYRITVQ